MERKLSWIPAALLLAALAPPAQLAAQPPTRSTPPAPAAPAPAVKIDLENFPGLLPTMPIEQVKVGQRGYGLSVFAGQEPERFEVEVVGVMRNSSAADLSYVLARLTGKGLEKAGVVAGMSGSPVFIDGKLVGAVSFGWPFSVEALGGITPIANMRDLSQLGGPRPHPLPTPVPAPISLAELQAGRVPKDLLVRELSRLSPQAAPPLPGAAAAMQFATVGFGPRSQAVLQQALGNVAPAGSIAPGTGSKLLAPGSAVAAMLMDGDLQMASFGTVTDHYGDHVLAFGHPFLGYGPIRIPMSTAQVVTVMSSQYSSFKISNLGEIVGAFEQDRQVGIAGRIGAEAPTLPLTLRFKSRGAEPARELKMRLADFPELIPALIGSATLAGLERSSRAAGGQSLDLRARFLLPEHGEIVVRQSFDGEDAGIGAASYVLSLAGYITRNPFQRMTLSGVEVDLVQSPEPRGATLVGAMAERTLVRPGEKVGVVLDLAAHLGERYRHRVETTLPEDLPAGRYSLLVGDGASIDGARLKLEPAQPVSFAQSLAVLRRLHSRSDLMILGFYDGPGLSVAGEVMPRLPGSMRALWGAAASGSAVPLRSTVAQLESWPMDRPIEGLVRIDLTVRRRGHLDDTDTAGVAAPAAAPGTATATGVPPAGEAGKTTKKAQPRRPAGEEARLEEEGS